MEIGNAIIINEGERFLGNVSIEDGIIKQVIRTGRAEDAPEGTPYLLPGVIDDHVHMRDPGMTHKATMESETRAAARGGVTTVLDMPNVVPQTTTNELLDERYKLAAQMCHVNYGFYLGATNTNLDEIKRMDTHRCPGVKMFMGSSTGGMLVDKEQQLRDVFRNCTTLIMTHCEDTARINHNMEQAVAKYGADPEVIHHPEIRDRKACMLSTQLAVKLAKEEGARLHVAHLTTADELELFTPNDPKITAEACVAHLMFTDEDYKTLGSRIKCNPAIKSKTDREELRKALTDGRIRVIGTDHAPHLLSEKQGGCKKAMSGMPMVQFSLPCMLELTDEGVMTIERMVQLMCHNPAILMHIKGRGFIREGYYADLVLVRPDKNWQVTQDKIESLCGWSPLEGHHFNWSVERTWVNGQEVWNGEQVNTSIKGMPVEIV